MTDRIKPTLLDRFLPRVNVTDDCWLWTGQTIKSSTLTYGCLSIDRKHVKAHRIAYELFVGPIPDGLVIDHTCHVPLCVRPDHLRAVTPNQNNQNRAGANRSNPTGIRGVYWVKAKQRFLAQVRYQGVQYFGGHFTNVADAEAAAIALRNKVMTHNDADRTSS